MDSDEEIDVEDHEISSKENGSFEGCIVKINLEFDQNKTKENKRNMYRLNTEQLRAAHSRSLNVQGAYKYSDYNNLSVSGEIKELFKMIQR